MEQGYDYDTYNNLSFSVPSVVGFIVVLVHLSLMILIGKFWGNDKLIYFLYSYSKIVFRGSLDRTCTDNNNNINRIEFQKYFGGLEKRIFLFCLSLVTTLVIWCVFISFWASFLLEETNVCTFRLDCFTTNSSLSSTKPDDFVKIENCDEVPRNATVLCLQFDLNLTEGFSYAVGFFGVAVAYIHFYSKAMVWIMKASLEREFSCVRCGLFFCWGCLIFGPFILLPIIGILDASINTKERYLQRYAYVLFFVYAGPFIAFVVNKYLYHPIKNGNTSEPAGPVNFIQEANNANGVN